MDFFGRQQKVSSFGDCLKYHEISESFDQFVRFWWKSTHLWAPFDVHMVVHGKWLKLRWPSEWLSWTRGVRAIYRVSTMLLVGYLMLQSGLMAAFFMMFFDVVWSSIHMALLCLTLWLCHFCWATETIHQQSGVAVNADNSRTNIQVPVPPNSPWQHWNKFTFAIWRNFRRRVVEPGFTASKGILLGANKSNYRGDLSPIWVSTIQNNFDYFVLFI